MHHHWAQVWSATWRTALFYVLLLVLLRLTGKREISTVSAIDLVGFVMIAEAALISIDDGKIPVTVGLAPVLVLALLQLIFSLASLKSLGVRRLVVGQPSVLIEHGRLNRKALAQLRYTVHDLMAELRSKNVPNVADVEFAVMETTGKLSVIPKPHARPATPGDLQALQVADPQKAGALSPAAMPQAVIADGVVDDTALERVGRDRQWLRQALAAQGVHDPAEVLLASVDGRGNLDVQRDGTAAGHAGAAPAGGGGSG